MQKFYLFLIFILMPFFSVAAGMLPETSIVLLHEEAGVSSILLENTDDQPLLLYSNIQNLPEDGDEAPLVMLSPPMVRVEEGERQQVRFALQLKQPLQVQRVKRVLFEGIPLKQKNDKNKIDISVRQNLPLIIHPRGLPKNPEPWKLLKGR